VNFSFTTERLDALERSVSTECLAYYVAESEGDLEGGLRLYNLNARLSAMFYGPLQGLEVSVRNAINDQFCAAFGPHWHDLTLIRLQPQQIRDVEDAVAEAGQHDGAYADDPPTTGEIVAELRFAFWVGVLGPKNENEIWRKALYRAFPHRPKGIERKGVHGALNSLRRLRNRIAHHGRILHRDLVADHDLVLEAVGWICPHTRDWIAANSAFDPSELPEKQPSLPMEGIPTETIVATPRPTRDGRPRLSITTGK
jgi:hypothetical protein